MKLAVAPHSCQFLLGGPGRDGAGAPGERPGARDRGQGGPADPRLAVQLGRGDRAGGLVRGALDPVEEAAAAGAAPAAAVSAAAPSGMAGLPGRRGLFALVVYSGFAGAQVTQANFSVTFIYVIFWVGTPVASVLFGDVFRALSPWRTCARVLRGARCACVGAGSRGGPAAALPAVAGNMAGGRGDRGLRLARADLRRTRPARRRWRRCRSATSC